MRVYIHTLLCLFFVFGSDEQSDVVHFAGTVVHFAGTVAFVDV